MKIWEAREIASEILELDAVPDADQRLTEQLARVIVAAYDRGRYDEAEAGLRMRIVRETNS